MCKSIPLCWSDLYQGPCGSMVQCMLVYRNIYVNQWRYIWCGERYKIHTPRRCIRIFGEICGNLWTTTPLQIPTDSHKSPQTPTDRHRPSSDSRPKSPQISYRSLWISTGSPFWLWNNSKWLLKGRQKNFAEICDLSKLSEVFRFFRNPSAAG